MTEDSTFTQHKEIVTRLKEPLKIKAVPYATTKLRGHQIQIEMNISWDQIDEFTGKNGIIINLIENMKYHIENTMKSKYLGVIMPEELK
ncbi:hypothetical protein [Nitrososphaeria virus YSH_462411]|uniref:Uncharacterized protein n=1 Tax=Nitrososphaeria virus YSH_462411 TaxID=3071321 RepID=A0A976UAH0_9CAUD|nr:hypothetical protein QKV92_gp37 [Yangshan Harbor Nitrososphaeria virus]UVF62309.1 hypothetical protein [Nitrososphaeria virus YSH_462411]